MNLIQAKTVYFSRNEDRDIDVCTEYPAHICQGLTFINQGAVNVTIGKQLVLAPGASTVVFHNYPYYETGLFQIKFAPGVGEKNLVVAAQIVEKEKLEKR